MYHFCMILWWIHCQHLRDVVLIICFLELNQMISRTLSQPQRPIEQGPPPLPVISTTEPQPDRWSIAGYHFPYTFRSHRIGPPLPPRIVPQISETNYRPQPRLRELFRGTILSIPQTPVSAVSLASGIRELVVGQRGEASESRPLTHQGISAVTVAIESPKSINSPLPDPGPSQLPQQSSRTKKVAIAEGF